MFHRRPWHRHRSYCTSLTSRNLVRTESDRGVARNKKAALDLVGSLVNDIEQDQLLWVDPATHEDLLRELVGLYMDCKKREAAERVKDAENDEEDDEALTAGPSSRRIGAQLTRPHDRVLTSRSPDQDPDASGKRKRVQSGEAHLNGGDGAGVQQRADVAMVVVAGAGTGGCGSAGSASTKARLETENEKRVKEKADKKAIKKAKQALKRMIEASEEAKKQAKTEEMNRKKTEKKREEREREKRNGKRKKRADVPDSSDSSDSESSDSSNGGKPPGPDASASDTGSSSDSDSEPDCDFDLSNLKEYDPSSPDAVYIPMELKTMLLLRVPPPISAFISDSLRELGNIVNLNTKTFKGMDIPDFDRSALAFASDSGIDRNKFVAAMPNLIRSLESKVIKKPGGKPVNVAHHTAVHRIRGAANIIGTHFFAADPARRAAMFEFFLAEYTAIFQGRIEALYAWSPSRWENGMTNFIAMQLSSGGSAGRRVRQQREERRPREEQPRREERSSREEPRARDRGYEERAPRVEERDRRYESFRSDGR